MPGKAVYYTDTKANEVGNMFGSFTLYYTSAKGVKGTLPFFSDDDTCGFVEEFLSDHPGYTVERVEEEVE